MSHHDQPWWVRRAGEREPVTYLTDVDRLKRDASALVVALDQLTHAIENGHIPQDHDAFKAAKAVLVLVAPEKEAAK